LASQAALAIESVRLADDLRQRQSEAHFRGLIQNASDVIVVVDAAGTITYATPSLQRALGREVHEVLGTSLFALLHEDDVADARSALESVTLHAAANTTSDDWRVATASGGFVSFEVLSNNLIDDTTVAGIVLTMRDVSERRALEEQLIHQAFHDSLTGLAN